MEYISSLEIGQSVKFTPMERHCRQYGIEKSSGYGTITAIKFTKAKVFYDVVSDYWGILFDTVDSANVQPMGNTS